MVDIQWDGLSELGAVMQKAMKRSPKLVSAVLKNKGEELRINAWRTAPVDTGFLKSNIRTNVVDDYTVDIASEAGYAGFQEYGTRFQTGTPHIRPAFYKIVPGLERDMRDVARGIFE